MCHTRNYMLNVKMFSCNVLCNSTPVSCWPRNSEKLIRHNFFSNLLKCVWLEFWNCPLVRKGRSDNPCSEKKNIKENFKWSLHDFCFNKLEEISQITWAKGWLIQGSITVLGKISSTPLRDKRRYIRIMLISFFMMLVSSSWGAGRGGSVSYSIIW